MQCNHCTPHVLDGLLRVELCTCMLVLELPASSAGQLKQVPFSSKMAFHVLLLCHTHQRVWVLCVCAQQRIWFTSVVKCLSLGFYVNARLWSASLLTPAELNTHLQAFGCELTVFYFWFTVEPPSDLKFKILNENTVEMSWQKPSSRIEGFRIQVVSDAGQCFRLVENACI